MEYNAFDMMKSKINKGITTVSVKTGNSVEKAKLNTYMDVVNAEINSLKQDVGNRTYVLWDAGNFDLEKLLPELEMIKKKIDTVEEIKQQILEIDNREREILGQTAGGYGTANEGSCVCPNCGASFKDKVNFCVKCGSKTVTHMENNNVLQQLERPVSGWNCKKCLESNPAEYNFCKVCGSAKSY